MTDTAPADTDTRDEAALLYEAKYQRNAFGDMTQRGRIAFTAFKSGWAARDDEIKRLREALETQTHNMNVMNREWNHMRTTLEMIAEIPMDCFEQQLARAALKATDE